MDKIKSRHLESLKQLDKIANKMLMACFVLGVMFLFVDPMISLAVVCIPGTVAVTFKCVNYFEVPKATEVLEEGLGQIRRGEYFEKLVCDKDRWKELVLPKFEATELLFTKIRQITFVITAIAIVATIASFIAYESGSASDLPLVIAGGLAIFVPIIGVGGILAMRKERNQWKELANFEDESVRTLYLGKDFWVLGNNFIAIPKDQRLTASFRDRSLRLTFRKGKYLESMEFPVSDNEVARANEIIREYELRNENI